MIHGQWACLVKVYRCVYRLYEVIASRSRNNERETNQLLGIRIGISGVIMEKFFFFNFRGIHSSINNDDGEVKKQ